MTEKDVEKINAADMEFTNKEAIQLGCGIKGLGGIFSAGWDHSSRTYIPEKTLTSLFIKNTPKVDRWGYANGHATSICMPGPSMLLFSQGYVSTLPYGDMLKECIEANKLGVVTVVEGRNAVYADNHQIKLYVWNVNMPALKKWLTAKHAGMNK